MPMTHKSVHDVSGGAPGRRIGRPYGLTSAAAAIHRRFARNDFFAKCSAKIRRGSSFILFQMKLATLRNGSRDGQLVVVSRDLTKARSEERRVGKECRSR